MSRISRGLGWGNKDKYEFSYIEKLSCIKDLRMQVCDLYVWIMGRVCWLDCAHISSSGICSGSSSTSSIGCSRSGSSRFIYLFYLSFN